MNWYNRGQTFNLTKSEAPVSTHPTIILTAKEAKQRLRKATAARLLFASMMMLGWFATGAILFARARGYLP
jgi:hypothetical protein